MALQIKIFKLRDLNEFHLMEEKINSFCRSKHVKSIQHLVETKSRYALIMVVYEVTSQ